jgi:hypothetical protein
MSTLIVQKLSANPLMRDGIDLNDQIMIQISDEYLLQEVIEIRGILI